jgi:DNA-directed RNA polymerase I, II, and III subunit RPABC5
MIIPVRCFGCGGVLADKYRHYQELVKKNKLAKGLSLTKIEYFTAEHATKTVEGTVLDELGITRACCRARMLTHVDIE